MKLQIILAHISLGKKNSRSVVKKNLVKAAELSTRTRRSWLSITRNGFRFRNSESWKIKLCKKQNL